MRTSLFLLLLAATTYLSAQPQLEVTELAPMPIPITNNAVVAAQIQGQHYVYSFGGIRSGLTYADITQAAFRYNVATNTWDTLPPLPDTLGKIASAASYVDGKIYIIGGYHVFANGDEVSSSRVHVFDPATNTYLPDGAPVPVPIDDQVQAVWRDSLIYVVAGWNNTAHVTNVQIYNPATNTWSVGSPIPNNSDYKAFGASGVMVDDTIYYMGGARTGLGFPAAPELRKGVINPNDPTQISWSYSIYFNTAGYRMGAAVVGDWAVWVGGGANTYNFNAAAYDGSGLVPPENRIILYHPASDTLVIYFDSLPVPFMDLRGTGQLDSKRFITCGGILDNAQVSNRTYLFQHKTATGISEVSPSVKAKIYPNPTMDILIVEIAEPATIMLTDLAGKRILSQQTLGGQLQLLLGNSLIPGYYLLRIETNNGVQVERIVVW